MHCKIAKRATLERRIPYENAALKPAETSIGLCCGTVSMRAVLNESPTLVQNGPAFSCVIVERNAANVLNLHSGGVHVEATLNVSTGPLLARLVAHMAYLLISNSSSLFLTSFDKTVSRSGTIYRLFIHDIVHLPECTMNTYLIT